MVAVLGLLAVPATRADQQVTPASMAGSEPVTVTKADGGTVKGDITSCTPELLVVQPAAKPAPKAKPNAKTPAAADPPKPDPVEVPWKDVRHVSNGLNLRLALDAWMAKHPTDLCPTCRGERTVVCPTCKGTNHDPAGRGACKTCHGQLLVTCKSAGEVDGKVPCPNDCLRLSVGVWTKHPDGHLWRTWKFSDKTDQSYSEGHLGHVVVADMKARRADDLGTCPICGGAQTVDDAACHGTGKVPCPECSAAKGAAACPNHCADGRVTCPTCGGTGLKKA